jgi:hypothetical protein
MCFAARGGNSKGLVKPATQAELQLGLHRDGLQQSLSCMLLLMSFLHAWILFLAAML